MSYFRLLISCKSAPPFSRQLLTFPFQKSPVDPSFTLPFLQTFFAAILILCQLTHVPLLHSLANLRVPEFLGAATELLQGSRVT